MMLQWRGSQTDDQELVGSTHRHINITHDSVCAHDIYASVIKQHLVVAKKR